MLNICRDGILQNIISKHFGIATYSNFKGNQFRTIRLSKVEPWILEGMDALEEKRAQKWKEETEIRAQRRAEGIMYDEEKVVGGKIRFLYGSEYRKMYDPDGEFYQMLLMILVAIVFGVAAFLYVKADLMKRRQTKMFERKQKTQNAMEEKKKELKDGN